MYQHELKLQFDCGPCDLEIKLITHELEVFHKIEKSKNKFNDTHGRSILATVLFSIGSLAHFLI